MTDAPMHRDVERLALLKELQLPAALLVPGLEAIARMAARQCGCPVGTVTIVDADRIWLHAAHGAGLVEFPRGGTFSDLVIRGTEVLELTDVANDPRFVRHPLVTAPEPTRFFAGMPIRVDGQAIAAVTVIDRRPRTLEPAARATLADLAATAEAIFEARLRELRRDAHEARARAASRVGSDWLWATDADGVLTWTSDSVQQHTGWPASRELGQPGLQVYRAPPESLRAAWQRFEDARARRAPFRDVIAERDAAHGPMLVAMSGEPQFDADGHFRGYIGAARDVTAMIAERERAERAQQMLLKAIDEVHTGLMISGPDGRVLISNAAWRKTIGPYADGPDSTWEQIVRRMVREGVYPDATGQEDAFIAWRLSLPSPEATLHEVRFRHQDALISDQLLPDGSVIHLSLDITERRRTERELLRQRAELEASQARIAAVLRAVPDLWFVIDRDDRYRQCSDDSRPWLVRHFDELRGRPIGDALPPDVAALATRAVRAARDSGEVQRIEYELETIDGVLHSFEGRVSPMPDGEVLYMTRDVTELRRLENNLMREAERLRVSEELYRSVADSISDGLLVVASSGAIVACNPSACELLGETAARLIGRRLSELGFALHDEDDRRIPMEEHPVRKVLGGGPGVRDQAHRLHRPDGSVRTMLVSVRSLDAMPSGTPLRCLVTFRDVTDQRAAEQALRDRKALELASRAKSEFLSRMSHEMRTPLNAVIGFTQLLRLQGDDGGGKVAEYADHVLRASEHLLALINEVLDLQRVEEGRMVMQPEPVALAPFVDSVLDLMQPMAQRQQVALDSRVPPGIFVRSDTHALRQVLINVTSNAVKYNRPGGWVCVSLLDAPAGRVAIGIEDTGSGLSQEEIGRLFQPFERLGHESSEIEGSGLGLVIARALTQAMDGSLTLSSVPGAGTLARVELPEAAAPSEEAASGVDPAPAPSPDPTAPAPTSAPPGGQPLRMLYVEDNRINALLFEEAMRILGGFELRVAEDGAGALEVIEGWRPQVLVLDAHLPDMSGFEVLRQLRARGGLDGVPAFMCSADAMPEDIERARAAGFTGYWTKPILIDAIRADLEALRAANPG